MRRAGTRAASSPGCGGKQRRPARGLPGRRGLWRGPGSALRRLSGPALQGQMAGPGRGTGPAFLAFCRGRPVYLLGLGRGRGGAHLSDAGLPRGGRFILPAGEQLCPLAGLPAGRRRDPFGKIVPSSPPRGGNFGQKNPGSGKKTLPLWPEMV